MSIYRAPASGKAAGRRLIAAPLVLLATLSCGDDDPVAPPPPPPPVATSITVSPATATLASLGQTAQLTARVLDQNGQVMTGAVVTWTSSDATVVMVDETGLVTATGDGSTTVTATTGDDGVSGSAAIVVEAGGFRDDFGTPASQERWKPAHNAEVTVREGVLSVTNRTAGRMGIAERTSTPAVNEWTIRARMGRKAREASPGAVALTGHSRYTAIRLVLGTLDDSGSDRRSGNYEFAVFDREAQEWVRITNMSGASEAVREEADEFTDIRLGHEGGYFVAYAGEGDADELFRLDAETSLLSGVVLRDVVEHATGVWLVNRSAAGLTAVHDWIQLTGTKSMAVVPDGAEIAGAPDAATRSENVTSAAEVLMALFDGTRGSSWVRSDHWGTDAPVGEWYGVTTDERGRVTRLDLGHNELTGTIPTELGHLTALRVLDLHHNALTGAIPPELGRLKSLEVLNLLGNRAVASSAGDQGFEAGVEPGAGPALDSWRETPGMADPGAAVRGRPESARGSPATFASRPAAPRYQEGLTGTIPPELGALTELKALFLSTNNLTGPIPPELGALAKLDTLSLWNNQLEGSIPRELGNLGSLVTLWLGTNRLTGSIPPELGRLANLKNLVVSQSELTGTLPSELGDLANLEFLILWGNELTGPIPAELGNLANLKNLGLSRNPLTGSIPPELGNLANLEFLILWDNELTGPIPAELGNLANLKNLGLSRNPLTGSIPPELGNLANLEFLILWDNELTGPIPAELGNLANLKDLTLSGN
ncbi:Ig-like domain-containing protein, partial [Candidatus Palauibacter polyketidifaciens]|uniref:leucine-rich repeat domain-containing protein n=1 Tax=Candidatus Palauibacter polyketidifaciens TaxID=3056740 RepID=UPI00238D06DD